jgi:hypothetical protein
MSVTMAVLFKSNIQNMSAVQTSHYTTFYKIQENHEIKLF